MRACSKSFQPSESLHPQRSTSILCPGLPTVAKRILDASTMSRILVALKHHGYTVTQLFEAAEALATFEQSATQAPLKSDAHVTFDIST
jgi:hypothetical protein